MSLDMKLAEIEVFSEDILQRLKTESEEKKGLLKRYLLSLQSESKDFFMAYTKARAYITENETSQVERYTGEFAFCAKNMADNLSLFLQEMYGTEPATLSKLEKNTRSAPRAKNGLPLHELFRVIHDHGKQSNIMQLRNARAHAGSKPVLREYGKKFYALPGQTNDVEASYWLDQMSTSYLALVSTCLETVSNSDVLNPREGKLNETPYARMAKNRSIGFVLKWAAVAASALIGIGVAGGIGGTIAYQNYKAKEVAEESARKGEFVLAHSEGILKSGGDIAESTIARDYRKEILMKQIEIYADNVGIENLNDKNSLVREYLEKNSVKYRKKKSENK